MLPVSCFGSTNGRCISTVSSPARVLGVGGTFQRVDQFGGFLGINWGSALSGVGTAAKAVLPTLIQGGIGLGFTVLTAKVLSDQAKPETPRQQVATTSQGPLDLAAGEAQAERNQRSENTLNMVLGIAAAAVVASILISRRR